MAYQTIEILDLPEQTFRIVLDGIQYTMRVYWTEYDDTIKEIMGDIPGQWRIDIFNEDNSVNFLGVALVGGCDLIGQYNRSDILGALWVIDNTQQGIEPEFESWGRTHELLYIPKDETEAFHRAIGWQR